MARNKKYALVTCAWTIAIGRRCGPTATLSGWTLVVEIDEHAVAHVTIAAITQQRAQDMGSGYHGREAAPRPRVMIGSL
ncbi:MAG TPA: hypothetical protein VFD36_23180, partial [Kofleriaceae bacterium]|nr:hypothetical protein [Kofleriaceae bacterium]